MNERTTPTTTYNAGPRVGLALSGGGVLGMAHLGVIKVLQEHRIPIHCVAGTSAGSLAGAFLAAGYSFEKMWEIARGLTWGRIGGVTLPTKGLVNSRLLERLVKAHLGSLNIEDLPMPYAAVAVDLTTGDEIVYTEGPLARAVRASCIIPGVFTPLEEGDSVIVDGGLRSFLPVPAVRTLGADYVIAVRLVPSVRKRKRPENLLQILANTFDLTVASLADLSPKGDAEILPNLEGMNSYDFRQSEELVQRGIEAAEKEIVKIEKQLQAAPRRVTFLRRILRRPL